MHEHAAREPDPARPCLACNAGNLQPLVDLGASPALTGALWDDAQSAREATVGRLDLAVCRRCSHVTNTAFDESLVTYDRDYDNSLHHSPTFRRFAAELAARLVLEHGMRGKRIVEIGSGKGDFLEAVCRLGGNTGTGYDPTVDPDLEIPGVRLVADYFRPADLPDPYDLLVCRHVLEHLADPAAMLRALRATAPADALFYLEVPAAEFNFGPDGMWDCIYPHVSYFSAQSLEALVIRCGFDVTALGTGFDGQFLWVEARPARTNSSLAHRMPPGVDDHLDRLSGFRTRWRGSVDHWRDQISHRRIRGEGLALWGAGAKGVTFLNAVDPERHLIVTDLNPNKWFRHLPGTGHVITSPQSLAELDVSTVLITNPVYRDEIASQLVQLGVHADVMTV